MSSTLHGKRSPRRNAALLLSLCLPAIGAIPTAAPAAEKVQTAEHRFVFKKVGKASALSTKDVQTLRSECGPNRRGVESDVAVGSKQKYRSLVIVCSRDENVREADLKRTLRKQLGELGGELHSYREIDQESRGLLRAEINREISRLDAPE
jgi:hypothetical protein